MREELMKLIASRHELLVNLNTSIPKLFGLAEYLIANDVIRVVRCKDCHNFTKSKWCNLLMMDVKDDGFCSYGERIPDETSR